MTWADDPARSYTTVNLGRTFWWTSKQPAGPAGFSAWRPIGDLGGTRQGNLTAIARLRSVMISPVPPEDGRCQTNRSLHCT